MQFENNIVCVPMFWKFFFFLHRIAQSVDQFFTSIGELT